MTLVVPQRSANHAGFSPWGSVSSTAEGAFETSSSEYPIASDSKNRVIRSSTSSFMAGYSGTPLAKKLGIKAGFRVSLTSVPAEVTDELREALALCQKVNGLKGPLDFIFLLAKSRRELERKFKEASAALAPAGMLWISWPKKSSGIASDLTEDVIREIGLRSGLVDVKVCAVTEIWSGLKFVIPVSRRK
jgi:hypothetical protein